MGVLIRKRLIGLVIVLIGVTVLSFILSNISTIDPAEAFARRTMLSPTQDQIGQIREDMGLNKPVFEQYFHWLTNSIRGDLGTSLLTRKPVAEDIAVKLPATLAIIGMACVWIIVFSIPVSMASAVKRRGVFDHSARTLSIIGISVPNFWLGYMLLVSFAVLIPVFRVVEYGSVKSLMLPSLTLAIPVAAALIRVLRASLLTNLTSDYVVYAQARGIPKNRILLGYVLKNALPPSVTLFFQNLGYMIAGSAIVEMVFSWPGIGSHLVGAIIARDLPTINGCVLVIALIFVICNLLADIINIILCPKTTAQAGGLEC